MVVLWELCPLQVRPSLMTPKLDGQSLLGLPVRLQCSSHRALHLSHAAREHRRNVPQVRERGLCMPCWIWRVMRKISRISRRWRRRWRRPKGLRRRRSWWQWRKRRKPRLNHFRLSLSSSYIKVKYSPPWTLKTHISYVFVARGARAVEVLNHVDIEMCATRQNACAFSAHSDKNQFVEVLNYAQVLFGVERKSLWMGIVDAERKMKIWMVMRMMIGWWWGLPN